MMGSLFFIIVSIAGHAELPRFDELTNAVGQKKSVIFFLETIDEQQAQLLCHWHNGYPINVSQVGEIERSQKRQGLGCMVDVVVGRDSFVVRPVESDGLCEVWRCRGEVWCLYWVVHVSILL